MKTVTGFVICLGVMVNALSQTLSTSPPAQNGQTKDFIPASPSAANLGIFGQVPVGNFTGTANVSVPFYTVNYKDLNVPIGVSYHAAGNKPGFFPGIVGLGWALNAGGSITRVVKGVADYEDYYNGTDIIPWLYNPTGEDDWSSTASLNTNLASGGFSTDQDRTNPDEFYFNFNGISGKFYMSQVSTFKIKSSSDEYFTVKGDVIGKNFSVPELEQDESMDYIRAYTPSFTQGQLLYKITITDSRGVKYIFGGTNNSIEFSRPGHSYSSHDMATIDKLITPMTWQLTSIESPNGYKITFDYEQGYLVTKVPYCDAIYSEWHKQGSSSATTTVTPASVAMAERSTLVNTSYLSTITTPKEVITFSYSDATGQLQFPADPTIYSQAVVNENMFNWYGDIGRAHTEGLVGKKLDAITIKDATPDNVLNKTIRFNYTNDVTTRLKLTAAVIYGNDDVQGPAWLFEYNELNLPAYLSYETDYYGYYNGLNTYINTTNSAYYLFTLNQQDFFNSKAPNPAYTSAELLNKITYPTKGYTKFTYAPNYYSSKVETWPFTITSIGENKITGGVRIAQITNYMADGQVASSKKYYYTKDYLTGGTVSSGVQAYQPTYYESLSGNVVPPAAYSTWTDSYSGTISIQHWSSNPIFPLSETRGNNVTYSEVTEVNEDGSAIVYKYKNYDNGYNDVAPLNQVSDNTGIKEFWKEDEGISMDLERGQILSESYYDAAKTLKKQNVYEYNDDPGRFDNNVRVLMQTYNLLKRSDIKSMRITASLIYTYFPYLKKVTQTEYEPNQTAHETVVNYEYDADYRLVKKQETTTSDGRVVTVLNSYPKDMVAAGITDPYQDMVTLGEVGMLVSSEQQTNGVKITKNTTAFSSALSPSYLILPQLVKTQYKNNAEEGRMNFNQYDSYGNLVCSSPQDGIKTCYVWSYNYTYPVAKIVNADYATVLSVLGGQSPVDAFAASYPDDATVNSFLQVLRSNTSLLNAFVSTYTYNLATGMTSQTDPNNRITYYEYDYMGRLDIVRDQNNNILKKLCYNYAGQTENCGITIPYEEEELLYSTTTTNVCNSNAILLVVMAYSKKQDPESGQLSLVPNELFTDKECTTPLPDGYYRPANKTGMYYHVVDGKTGGETYLCF